MSVEATLHVGFKHYRSSFRPRGDGLNVGRKGFFNPVVISDPRFAIMSVVINLWLLDLVIHQGKADVPWFCRVDACIGDAEAVPENALQPCL